VSRQNDVLGRCKGCGAPPEEACVCGAAVRASTAPDVRRALARCALALSREADTIRELAPTIDGKCYLDHIVDDACEALGCTAGELAKISESRPEIVRKFYIHDTTRGCVGNSMVWWKRGHHGYTCDIREAHVFFESELPQYLRHATDLVAYPVEHVRATVAHHIDAQRIDRSLGVKREDLAVVERPAQ